MIEHSIQMLERQKHRIKHRVDQNVSASAFVFDTSTNVGEGQESKPALLRFFLDHVLGDRDYPTQTQNPS